MFPGPYATVIRNDAGEPIGWDDHYHDEPDYDPFGDLDDGREYDDDDDDDEDPAE